MIIKLTWRLDHFMSPLNGVFNSCMIVDCVHHYKEFRVFVAVPQLAPIRRCVALLRNMAQIQGTY